MSDVDVSSLSQEDRDALLAKLLEKQAEKKSPSTPTKRATRKRTAEEAPSGEPVTKRKKKGETTKQQADGDPLGEPHLDEPAFFDNDTPAEEAEKRQEAKQPRGDPLGSPKLDEPSFVDDDPPGEGEEADEEKEEEAEAGEEEEKEEEEENEEEAEEEEEEEEEEEQEADEEEEEQEADEEEGEQEAVEAEESTSTDEIVEKAEKKTKKPAKKMPAKKMPAKKKPVKTTLSKKSDSKVGKKKAVKRPAVVEPEDPPAPKNRQTRAEKMRALKKRSAEEKKKHPLPTSEDEFSDEASEEDSGQEDDDKEPVPEVPTSFPDLRNTAPHGTPGNKSKNGIGQRHLLLKRVNRLLRQAHEEMEDHILRVGQLGDYDAGRHARNVKLTLTVESYDRRGQAKDSQTFTLPNFEPDHIANLFRCHYNDQFKNIANANCNGNHFTEEEIRTGKEIANPKEAGKIALQEFKKRNGGWTPKEFFGVDDKGQLKERAKYGKKPKRKKDGRTPRRDLNKADGADLE